jgi:hypothetical protein
MQMAPGRSRIPRPYSQQRQSQNKPGKNQSCQRIAYANHSQRSTSLHWVYQLQPTIHKKLLKNRNTAHRTYKEEEPLQLDQETQQSIQHAQTSIYQTTSPYRIQK